MQINITITVFKLLGFAKLSCKNRAAKNLLPSGAIAKSQIQRRSALFIAQNCAAKDSRHNREANIKHGTATITAKKQRCKEFSAQSRSLKSNTSQPQLPRKTAMQRICGAAAQSRSPKFNEGRHYLLRKTALQRIRGAAAQSRSQH